MSNEVKVYHYTRGILFNVDIIIKNKDTIMFKNIVSPKDSSKETIMDFLEEADKKVKTLLSIGGNNVTMEK